MLYVIILYCTGFCPADIIPPPSDVLFFTSYADCKAALMDRGALQISPNPLPGAPIATEQRETCARVFADSKQLDRLIVPDQLVKMVREHDKHPDDGWKPWIPAGCEGKTICTAADHIGPCGKGADYSCLFKPKEESSGQVCREPRVSCENALTHQPGPCSEDGIQHPACSSDDAPLRFVPCTASPGKPK